jgi:hypothetical protein
MKLKLRPVDHGKDKNRFCGPAVISAVTPLTTGEAARLIRKQSGRSAVMGTHNHEIRRALQACNIEMTAVTDYPGLNRTTGPTLAAWLKMSKGARTSDRIFLLTAGWHWQLISGRRYVCGRTGEIVSVRDKKVKRRARVADVWELTSDNVSRPSVDVSRPRKKQDPGYGRLQRWCKKNGVSYIRDLSYWDFDHPAIGTIGANDGADRGNCYDSVMEIAEERLRLGNADAT